MNDRRLRVVAIYVIVGVLGFTAGATAALALLA
jgi:hypothetical protein